MQLYAIFKQYEPKERDSTIYDPRTGQTISCFKPNLIRVGGLSASTADNAIELAKQIWSGPLLAVPINQI